METAGILFSNIQNLPTGADLLLMDMNTVYSYTVTSITTVSPSDGYVINDHTGKTEITLITCNHDESLRYVVSGSLAEHYAYSDASAALKQAFQIQETGQTTPLVRVIS